MKPRDFLNFFKTRSGKLVLFVVDLWRRLVAVQRAARQVRLNDDMDIRVIALADERDGQAAGRANGRATDAAVSSAAAEARAAATATKTNEPPKVVVEKPKQEPPPAAPRPSACSPTPAAGVAETEVSEFHLRAVWPAHLLARLSSPWTRLRFRRPSSDSSPRTFITRASW